MVHKTNITHNDIIRGMVEELHIFLQAYKRPFLGQYPTTSNQERDVIQVVYIYKIDICWIRGLVLWEFYIV